MRRLSGSKQAVQDQRDAIDALEGMPWAPSFIGHKIRDLVPLEHSPGALGWTEHLVDVVDELDGQDRPTGRFKIDVPDDVATRHHGKDVGLPGGRRVRVDLSGAVDVNGVGKGKARQ